MPVPSLLSQCISVLTQNIDQVTDIGEMEFATIRPALLKIESPVQLYTLERNCPQVLGHTAEIWRRLIKRDFPALVSKIGITDPVEAHDWHEIYSHFKEREQAEENAAIALLRKSMAKNDLQRSQNAVEPPTRVIIPKQARSKAFGWSRQPALKLFANNGMEKIRRGVAQTSALRRSVKPATINISARNPTLPAAARDYHNPISLISASRTPATIANQRSKAASPTRVAASNYFSGPSNLQPTRRVTGLSSPTSRRSFATNSAPSTVNDMRPTPTKEPPGNTENANLGSGSTATRSLKRPREVNCLRPVKRNK